MPEIRKAESASALEPSPKPAPVLAPASESGDPAVHQLLAARQTAEMNGSDEGVKAATDALAKLGFR